MQMNEQESPAQLDNNQSQLNNVSSAKLNTIKNSWDLFLFSNWVTESWKQRTWTHKWLLDRLGYLI